MKKILLATMMMFCFYGQSFGSFNDPAICPGTYALAGKNSLSSLRSYQGEVTIVPNGTTYSLASMIGQRHCQLGTGILNADILSVVYQDISTKSWGVVSYKLLEDGVLEGKWAPFSSTKYSYGTLTWKGQ